jgi:hypothetical protein
MSRPLCVLVLATALLGPVFSESATKVDCGHSTVADFSASLEPKANAFLASLKAAVKAQDKQRVAGMVHYPLLVNMSKGHKQIKTTTQLMAEYDRLFTASMRKAIEEQTAACLFANWQGVMIGDGEVWFEEQSSGSMKIKTLNIP